MKTQRTVTILQHRLLHYRVDLFDQLRIALEQKGIALNLVSGQASPREALRDDVGELDWACKIRNRYLSVGLTDICWQHIPWKYYNVDLIVLMQENRILNNYPIMFLAPLFNKKIAFWGHGINYQSKSPNGFREKWKKYLSNKVDWWFAYTDTTKKILLNNNYPSENISVLNNAINQKAFENFLNTISEHELSNLRKELSIQDNARIAIYCGSLYKDKKLNLLVDVATMIKNKIDRFYLLIVGDGSEKSNLMRKIADHCWIKYLGVKKHREKAAIFKLADIYLHPGATGLHVLDAFVAGIPYVTTNNAKHGPEFIYIENGVNGFVTDDTVDSLGNITLQMLTDQDLYNKIVAGALRSGKKYSLENMVNNFVEGIENCVMKKEVH